MTRLIGLLLSPFRRRPRRSLASRRPDRADMGQTTGAVPLGMEAIDLSVVDAVNRRNDALERVNTAYSRDKHQNATAGASLRIKPMPEDETYAARYHRAYIKKDD